MLSWPHDTNQRNNLELITPSPLATLQRFRVNVMSSRPVNICHSLTPQSQLHSLWSYRIHQKCKILGILHLHSMFEPTSHVRLKKLVNQQIQTCRRPASLYFYLYIGTHSRSLDYCTFLSPIISLPNNFQSVIMKLSSFLPLITDCSCSELCMSCKSFRD